jgi:hypothetical protein
MCCIRVTWATRVTLVILYIVPDMNDTIFLMAVDVSLASKHDVDSVFMWQHLLSRAQSQSHLRPSHAVSCRVLSALSPSMASKCSTAVSGCGCVSDWSVGYCGARARVRAGGSFI